jgi:hypothetical protein
MNIATKKPNKPNTRTKSATKTVTKTVAKPKPVMKDKVDLTDNYIYLLVTSHGCTSFNSMPDKTGKYSYIPIKVIPPQSVDYVGLITHPPLGCADIGNSTKAKQAIRNFSSSKFRNIIGLKGRELSLKIRELDRATTTSLSSSFRQRHLESDNPIEAMMQATSSLSRIESLLNYKEDEKWKHSTMVDASIFAQNPDSVYASTEFNKFTGKNNLLYKNFSLDEDKSKYREENIIVIFQKGGELREGNILIDSPDFLDYYAAVSGEVSESGVLNIQSLVDYLSFKGYKNIILIDYSCNSCKMLIGDEKVPRDAIRATRKAIENAKGGKQRRKKRNKTKKTV